jgi:hypothetical protein
MAAALKRPDHWKRFRAGARSLAKTVKALGVGS